MSAPPLHRLLDEFEALVRQGDPDAPAWAQARRATFMAQRDQLLKARFLLVGDPLGDGRAVAGLIDDLLLALRIFRANQRSTESARCLVRLSERYMTAGLDLAALAAGRMALDAPDLHLDDRIRLLGPMCTALAHQLRLPAAWALIEEVGGTLRRVSRDSDAWGRFELARAEMHFVEALRAARARSVYDLDLSDGPVDAEAMEGHLQACTRLLDSPPLLRGGRVGEQGLQLRALCAALRGEAHRALPLLDDAPAAPRTLAAVLRAYHLGWCLRVLGRPAEALAWLDRCAREVQVVASGKAELMLTHDRALCLSRLGRHGEAFEALSAFVQQRAALFAAETQALRRLEQAGGARVGGRRGVLRALTAREAPSLDDVGLLGTEPPCLAQAERALVQQLPRRLGMQALAAHTGVSVRTLQQAARRFRGQTLGALLRRRLMQEALQWMTTTDLTLQEIAARCAYRDASAFSRDFKRVHGCAPSVHREWLRRQAAQGGAAAPVEGEAS